MIVYYDNEHLAREYLQWPNLLTLLNLDRLWKQLTWSYLLGEGQHCLQPNSNRDSSSCTSHAAVGLGLYNAGARGGRLDVAISRCRLAT